MDFKLIIFIYATPNGSSNAPFGKGGIVIFLLLLAAVYKYFSAVSEKSGLVTI